MKETKRMIPGRGVAFILVFSLLGTVACTQQPEWKAKNNRIIRERQLAIRTRIDIPVSRIVPNLEPGVVGNVDKLLATEIAPGVRAKMYWGKSALVAWVTLAPGAEMASETLPSERLMVVLKGSVDQLLNGSPQTMRALAREAPDGTHGRTPKNEFVYLEKGARNGLKAGMEGAEIVEVYCPARPDYLKKAGAQLPARLPDDAFSVRPTVEPNRIYDLNEIQFTESSPGAYSRLIAGRGMQASFLRMNPGAVFAQHIHPEEQLMIVLRGSIDEIIMDGVVSMAKGDLLLLPADMVHGGTVGDLGCDVLDVFWPVRPDYTQKMENALAAFHVVIPADAAVELVTDGAQQGPGLVFTEGPKWLNGKLYLSSMYFDQQWNGDPRRSALVEMDPSGIYRYISHGQMQTNGLMPLDDGNLAVCDMFGHRVLEMTPRGKVVRTLASTYEGKPIDGPNDLVADAKGGIYFTDPQFTPDATKHQPGRAVYYITPKGGVLRVIGVNHFAMPNGILLNPNGRILLVNNTYDNESFWNVVSDKLNFVWAYEVNADGTVTSGRPFAELFLTPEVLDRRGRSSGADGMTMDESGGIYVATYMGVQMFSPLGEFIGIIHYPTYPVSCCFGGEDMQTLFAVSYDRVYKIRTNVKGLKYPPGARKALAVKKRG